MKFRIIDSGDYYDLKFYNEDFGWQYLNSRSKFYDDAVDYLKTKAKDFACIGKVLEEFEL